MITFAAGGPLVTYCSTLLNQHCSPSGLQLAAAWHGQSMHQGYSDIEG